MIIDIDEHLHIDDKINVLTLSTLAKLTLWYAPFTGDITQRAGFYVMANHQSVDEAFAHFFSLALGKKAMQGNVNGIFEQVNVRTADGYVLDGELYPRDSLYRLRITRAPSLRVVMLS
jgi:hypothetical protein